MERPFKVIIVGGGPVGLALGHALSLAGIEYALYEKNANIGEPQGAGLAIQPNNVRLLDQFGILDAARRLAPPMIAHRAMGPNGESFGEQPYFEWLRENHGYDMMLFERWQLIRLLYETLPNQEARVRTDKSLKRLEVTTDCVRVHFEDGSVDEGSIVVGADGVHSKVRELVSQRSQVASFTSTFQAIYGIGELPKGMDAGYVTEINHVGWWFQIITQPGRVFWMLYRVLPAPTSERIRYSDAEREALAAEFEDFEVGGGFTLKDIRRGMWREKLALLEEGIMPRWHSDRAVLVGDAIHKVTPNLAYSANMGLEDVAVLTNYLRETLRKHASPSTEILREVFSRYQDKRFSISEKYLENTAYHLRIMAWLTPWLRFRFSWPLPWDVGRSATDRQIAPLIAAGVKLDFVELKEQPKTRVPYDDEQSRRGGKGMLGRFFEQIRAIFGL
ncbi:FAD/NAD(P)-binding domain-containing protein [Thozetella sp. PMI_491]|nr:FAD/NAD(P)-binding domain-containing protein [Thozetella sp. PMI_491]